MSSHQGFEIFQPLGANHVYGLASFDAAFPPEYILNNPHQPRHINQAAQWAVLRVGHVMNSHLHSHGYLERRILYLPGCVSPEIYDIRLGILHYNLVNAPRILSRAVQMEDWVLCRQTAQDRLIPSCLQVVMNPSWKDSFTRTAAACGLQTCWTALWHIFVAKSCMFWSATILPELHQIFDAELTAIIAELIRKCQATLRTVRAGDIPVDVFFGNYLVNITAQFVAYHRLDG